MSKSTLKDRILTGLGLVTAAAIVAASFSGLPQSNDAGTAQAGAAQVSVDTVAIAE